MTFHPGPKLATVLPYPRTSVSSLHKEYSDLECTVEVVNNVQEAIDLINTYGSAHTDAIVTEDGQYVSSSYPMYLLHAHGMDYRL